MKLFDQTNRRKSPTFSWLSGFFLSVLLFFGPLFSQVALAQFSPSATASAIGTTLLQYIGQAIIWLTGRLVALAGYVLDTSTEWLVLEMATLLEQMGTVEAVWAVMRDLANMVFIFILLYAAISIILNISSSTMKRLLPRIILVALLVNFSLFFTQVIVDTSNVIALQFYDNMQVNVVDEGGNVIEEGDISYIFIESTNINSILNEFNAGASAWEVIAYAVMAGIFLAITAFVMLAAALLLVIRFVVLIFVMALAPLAFVAWILPGTRTYFSQWKDTLLSQAFYAPAYFALLYVVAKLLADNEFVATLAGGTSFAEGIQAQSGGAGGIIVSFLVIIAMMLATIVIAKQAARKGPRIISNYTNKAINTASSTLGLATAGTTAFALRQTAGRAGRRLTESERAKNYAESDNALKSYVGRKSIKLGDSVASKNFDARATKTGRSFGLGQPTRRGGYNEIIDEKQKQAREERDLIKRPTRSEQAEIQEAARLKDEAGQRSDEANRIKRSDEFKDIEKRYEASESRLNNLEAKLQTAREERENATTNSEQQIHEKEIDRIEQQIENEKQNAREVRSNYKSLQERIRTLGEQQQDLQRESKRKSDSVKLAQNIRVRNFADNLEAGYVIGGQTLPLTPRPENARDVREYLNRGRQDRILDDLKKYLENQGDDDAASNLENDLSANDQDTNTDNS